MIVIELNIGKFESSQRSNGVVSKLLDKNERKPDEEKPLGIILCADKDQEDYVEVISFVNIEVRLRCNIAAYDRKLDL